MKYRPSPPLQLLCRFLRSIELNGFRGALAHSCQRLFRSLKHHGLSGTLERAFVKAPLAPLTPAAVPAHPFDLFHGTETSGCISGADFPAVSLSSSYTTVYLGSPPSTIRAALSALPIKHEDFTFVDIGCGKGRALILAAEFPFRRLFGVEIAGALCEVARTNVALNPMWKERISIINEDATRFIFPEGPIVLFFFDPFFARVLRRVLANLERQLRRSRRPAYLVYTSIYEDLDRVPEDDPSYRKVMQSFSFIKEISDTIYPLTAEEIAAEPLGCKVSHVMLFSTDVTR